MRNAALLLIAALVLGATPVPAGAASESPWSIAEGQEQTWLFNATKAGSALRYRVCHKNGPRAVVIADSAETAILQSCADVSVAAKLGVKRASPSTRTITGTYRLLGLAPDQEP